MMYVKDIDAYLCPNCSNTLYPIQPEPGTSDSELQTTDGLTTMSGQQQESKSNMKFRSYGPRGNNAITRRNSPARNSNFRTRSSTRT
jgi:hypothetical protein